jgi:hypothetical protein
VNRSLSASVLVLAPAGLTLALFGCGGAPQDDGVDPCRCDDGLYCNGTETCDDAGVCLAGEAPVPVDDGDPCTRSTVCDESADTFLIEQDDGDPACAPMGSPPVVAADDYGFWYWPTNHRPTETWPTVEPVMHVRTGFYGLAFDESTGELLHFGRLPEGWTAAESAHRPNSDIDDLLAADLRFEAGNAGAGIVATGFTGVSGATTDRVRMIDGGRFMNRVEVPEVTYAADATLDGRVEIASMPRHVVFTHEVSGASAARVRLGGDALAVFPNVTWLANERALTLTDDAGQGWMFVVYDQDDATTRLSWSAEGGVLAERIGGSGPVAVSLLAAPLDALGEGEAEMYLDPGTAVQVTYTLLDADGADVGGPAPVEWDPTLGAYAVPLGTLQEAGEASSPDWETDATHNTYGRHRIEVDSGAHGPVAVPLAFLGSDKVSWYITGGVAILRDEDGEPLGVPVQISKNWHEAGNYWYHFYSQPTFAGAGADTMELTIASSRWGPAYAASHAQLSLIGWGSSGGHWDESALGAFGESVTYDPDVTLGRSMLDDVRPVLVQASRKWSWTGNVGGADFLRYTTATEPYWQRRLASVRSRYDAVGPLLTDVTYSGVSCDGRIHADVRTQLGATDDLVRVYYDLTYTFVEDVLYDRLAFFQFAADNYADNGFQRYAYGNAGGTTFDAPVPNHGTTGYATAADRGIALEGDSPWVLLYENTRAVDSIPETYADVGFVIRSFEADIGGTSVTTPRINIQRTNNGVSQMAFELGLPYEQGAPWCGDPCGGGTTFVPAGSTVHATIEYVVPPSVQASYYGSSAYLHALPASVFDTPSMMVELAEGNRLAVDATVGAVVRAQPVEIEAAPGAVATDVRLTGGRGYVPVTVRGLARHDGWGLEQEIGGVWSPMDQSVAGHDDRQASYDPDTDTYALTFVVPNEGTTRYRLVWSSER